MYTCGKGWMARLSRARVNIVRNSSGLYIGMAQAMWSAVCARLPHKACGDTFRAPCA